MPAVQNRPPISTQILIAWLCGAGMLAAEEAVMLDELPVRITEPGHYRIAGDLQFESASGAAISVEADDVSIDLDGRTLHGTAGADSLAVGVRATDQQKLVLTNGIVSGFYFGVDVRNSSSEAARSSGHVVSNLVLVRNHYFGMRLVGADSVVRHCTVKNTGDSTRPGHSIPHGVRLVGARNQMRHCTIIDLRLRRFPDGRGEIVGVHFDDAQGAVFADNRIVELRSQDDDRFEAEDQKERRFGMWINGGPQKNTFVTVTGNTFVGFPVPLAFAPGSDGRVTGNTFHGAGPQPIRGRPADQLPDNVSLNGSSVSD